MRKLLLLCFVLLCNIDTKASNIAWNTYTITKKQDSTYGNYYTINAIYQSPSYSIDVCSLVSFSIVSGSNLQYLKVITELSQYAAFGDNWVKTQKDTTIDDSNTRNQSTYFLNGYIDGNINIKSDYTINIKNGESVYLGVATANEGLDMNLPILYGWVELALDNNNIVIRNSALDLEGKSIIVGQVPEPTSALLAVIGGFLLLKRRK